MNDRDRLSAVSDALANVLGLEPERVMIEPATKRSPVAFVCLRVEDAEALLALVRGRA